MAVFELLPCVVVSEDFYLSVEHLSSVLIQPLQIVFLGLSQVLFHFELSPYFFQSDLLHLVLQFLPYF